MMPCFRSSLITNSDYPIRNLFRHLLVFTYPIYILSCFPFSIFNTVQSTLFILMQTELKKRLWVLSAHTLIDMVSVSKTIKIFSHIQLLKPKRQNNQLVQKFLNMKLYRSISSLSIKFPVFTHYWNFHTKFQFSISQKKSSSWLTSTRRDRLFFKTR